MSSFGRPNMQSDSAVNHTKGVCMFLLGIHGRSSGRPWLGRQVGPSPSPGSKELNHRSQGLTVARRVSRAVSWVRQQLDATTSAPGEMMFLATSIFRTWMLRTACL